MTVSRVITEKRVAVLSLTLGDTPSLMPCTGPYLYLFSPRATPRGNNELKDKTEEIEFL